MSFRIPDIKRIQKEDFPKDQQDLIEKLSFPLNSFMEQARSAFQNILNLKMELITLTVTVDAAGAPNVPTRYKSSLNTNVTGSVCISATNLTDSTVFPISQPFISFTQSGDLIGVNNISGLQADNKYKLVVLSIGK